MKIKLAEQLLTEASVQTLIDRYSDVLDSAQVEAIISIDPTANGTNAGKYSDWMLSIIKKQGDSKADRFLSHKDDIQNRLKLYDRYKKLLPERQREIFTFKTLLDFMTFMQDVDSLPEVIAAKEQDKQKQLEKELRQQATVLYKGSDWILWAVFSFQADRALGGDTRWCTAADNNGYYFNLYATRYNDPIYYILINAQNPKEKYQLHFGSKQFMDRADRNADFSRLILDNTPVHDAINKFEIGCYESGMYERKILFSKKIGQTFKQATFTREQLLKCAPAQKAGNSDQHVAVLNSLLKAIKNNFTIRQSDFYKSNKDMFNIDTIEDLLSRYNLLKIKPGNNKDELSNLLQVVYANLKNDGYQVNTSIKIPESALTVTWSLAFEQAVVEDPCATLFVSSGHADKIVQATDEDRKQLLDKISAALANYTYDQSEVNINVVGTVNNIENFIARR